MREKIRAVFNSKIVILLISFVTSYGLLMHFNNYSMNSISVFILIAMLIGIYKLGRETIAINNKRLKIFSLSLSIVLSLMYIFGSSINAFYNLAGLTHSIINTLYYFFSFVVVSYFIITNIFNWLDTHIESAELTSKKTWIALCFLGFIIAWLPYFLHFYPGVLTPDSVYQISQIIGENELTNHHPVLHTLFISIFVNFGKAVDNYNIGIGLYSIFQMIIMASCFTIAIRYMIHKKINKAFIIASFIFYAFYPIHAMYSITMWKDIPFALAVLLLTIQIDNLVLNKDIVLKNKKYIALLIINMILVMLLRNNGVYVIYILIPILIVSLRDNLKKIILISTCVIAFFILYKFCVFNLLNVKQVDISEALSVPVQQIARIEIENYEDLSAEEQNDIKRFIKSIDNLRNNYSPTISDPIKVELNSEEINSNKMDFLKLCAHLAFKFPKATLVSFLCQNYGYWYPDFSYWKIREGVSDYLRNIK